MENELNIAALIYVAFLLMTVKIFVMILACRLLDEKIKNTSKLLASIESRLVSGKGYSVVVSKKEEECFKAEMQHLETEFILDKLEKQIQRYGK